MFLTKYVLKKMNKVCPLYCAWFYALFLVKNDVFLMFSSRKLRCYDVRLQTWITIFSVILENVEND